MALRKENGELLIKLKKRLNENKNSLAELSSCLDELEKIKINKDLLKLTGIGGSIATLSSKSKFLEIQERSKNLVKKWKKSFEPKLIKKQEVQKVVLPRRVQAKNLLMKAFTDTEDKEKVEAICNRVEICLFRKFDENTDSKEYKTKLRSLKFNLTKNAELRVELLEGNLKPFTLSEMSSDELVSKEKRKEVEEQREKLFNEARSDWLQKNRDKMNKQAGIDQVGGFFKCEECKSTKTTHYQKQTRGADEPMTIFAQCTECGHNWRFGDH